VLEIKKPSGDTVCNQATQMSGKHISLE